MNSSSPKALIEVSAGFQVAPLAAILERNSRNRLFLLLLSGMTVSFSVVGFFPLVRKSVQAHAIRPKWPGGNRSRAAPHGFMRDDAVG
jgi:hypothetical protein